MSKEVQTDVKKVKFVKVGEYLRYDFSKPELEEISKKLAQSISRQARANEEQKAAQAQFKQRIEAETATIQSLSSNIHMGWEMRTIDCVVEFHTPVVGTKRMTRLDTGEIVREWAMRNDELQEHLFEDPNAVVTTVEQAADVLDKKAAKKKESK